MEIYGNHLLSAGRSRRGAMHHFHSLIKREWISRFRIMDYSHAYRLVFEYIEAFCNTVRIHSHCGYPSPSKYENQYLERMEMRMSDTAH